LINLEKDAEFNLILISKSALMKNILKGAIQKMRVFGMLRRRTDTLIVFNPLFIVILFYGKVHILLFKNRK